MTPVQFEVMQILKRVYKETHKPVSIALVGVHIGYFSDLSHVLESLKKYGMAERSENGRYIPLL